MILLRLIGWCLHGILSMQNTVNVHTFCGSHYIQLRAPFEYFLRKVRMFWTQFFPLMRFKQVFQTLFVGLSVLSKNNMGKNVMLPQTGSLLHSPTLISPGEKLRALLNCSFQLLADFYFTIKIFIDDSTWLLCPQVNVAL